MSNRIHMDNLFSRGVFIIFLLSLLSCSQKTEYEPIDFSSVTLSGCELVDKNNTCFLAAQTPLYVWLPLAELEGVSVSLGDVTYPIVKSFSQEGSLIKLNFGPSFPEGHLLIKQGTQNILSMPLKKFIPPKWLKVYEKRKSDKTFDQQQYLEKYIQDKPLESAIAFEILSKVSLKKNNIKKALNYIKQSNAIYSSLGITNKVIDNMTRAVYVELYLNNDIVAANHKMKNTPQLNSDFKSLYWVAYYQSLLAKSANFISQAIKYAVDAKTLANKHKDKPLLMAAEYNLSSLLLYNGQFKSAVDTRQEIVSRIPDSWPACQKIKYYDGLGWAQLQYSRHNSNHFIDPVPALKQALNYLEADCPTWGQLKANILINLGLSWLSQLNVKEASQILSKINALKTQFNLYQRLDLLELKGKLSLLKHDHQQALNLFFQQNNLAKKVTDIRYMLKSAESIALVYEYQGNVEKALQFYQQARSLLYQQVLLVPPASAPYYISANSQLGSRYIKLLIQENRQQEALEVSQFFRAFWIENMLTMNRVNFKHEKETQQWLALLSDFKQYRREVVELELQRWQIVTNELEQYNKKIAEKQLRVSNQFDKIVAFIQEVQQTFVPANMEPEDESHHLFFYPIDAAGQWAIFSKTQGDVETFLVNASPGKEKIMLASWFENNLEKINSSKVLKIYPYGSLREVDFHQLVVKDKILLDRLPIEYAVGIRKPATVDGGNSFSGKTLLVANSRGDLVETEKEVTSILPLLTEKKRTITLLKEQQTQFDTINNELTKAEHFHYAGHVYHDLNGSQFSTLPLANNTGINTADILMLKNTPRWVVLSGCESAISPKKVSGESLSLAHAFIASGSEKVIATNRPVRDKSAKILMTKFYDNWMKGSSFSEAFRRTQLDLFEQQPDVDWSSFRILTL